MRNWKAEARSRLATLDIAPTRLASIADEVGQHLEQRYTHLRTTGLSEDQAERTVLNELDGSDVLEREVALLASPGAADDARHRKWRGGLVQS